MTTPDFSRLVSRSSLFKPHRTDSRSPFARMLLGGGGILAGRDAPAYIADRRSLIAGLAIYGAVALLVLILAVVAMGLMEGR